MRLRREKCLIFATTVTAEHHQVKPGSCYGWTLLRSLESLEIPRPFVLVWLEVETECTRLQHRIAWGDGTP